MYVQKSYSAVWHNDQDDCGVDKKKEKKKKHSRMRTRKFCIESMMRKKGGNCLFKSTLCTYITYKIQYPYTTIHNIGWQADMIVYILTDKQY